MQKNKHNTIGKGSKQRAINGGEDKYFTKPYIADYLTSIVFDMYKDKYNYVEPCAGHGSFVYAMEKLNIPNIQAFDISPMDNNICNTTIKKQDWLSQENQKSLKKTIVLTNPPFGFMSQLAIDFFNKCASLEAEVIAFLIPKTFNKISVTNKLSMSYKLKKNIEIPPNSFLIEGELEYSVPCTFQIWERVKSTREIIEVPSNKNFSFCKKDIADIAIRRAGGRAGQVLIGLEHSIESTHFIKIHENNDLVLKAFKLMNINDFINNTAGVRSISKDEINLEMNRLLNILI